MAEISPEIVNLQNEIKFLRKAISYLADEHATTLETLPTAISKKVRERHIEVCEIAFRLLNGDSALVRFPPSYDVAKLHCHKVLEKFKIY